MDQSLDFLYHRIKNPNIRVEEAQSKVCQEILVSKIASDELLNSKVAFKGGLIIDAITNGKRGYTKDIDFDLIKYPLSDEALSDFFSRLNSCKAYPNIMIDIESIKELRHKNYQGRRVELCFSDKKSNYKLTVDIGIFIPLIKRNLKYEYNVSFGDKRNININPVERIIAEKISTFGIYLTDNTRVKDLYDAYYLITSVNHNKHIVFRMLKELLVNKNHFYKSFDLAVAAIVDTLRDKQYVEQINLDKRNWTDVSTPVQINTIIDYLLK